MVIRLESNNNPFGRESPTWQDIDDTNTELQTISMLGIAQNAYQTLQSNNVFENKDFLATDEFTDSNGTNNTVDNNNSSASYNEDNLNYVLGINDEASGDTTHDPDTFTNPSNAFDGDKTTTAVKSEGTTGAPTTRTWELGKTFGAKNVNFVYCVGSLISTRVDSGNSISAALQGYDGSIWTTISTLVSFTNTTNSSVSLGFRKVLDLGGASYQGLRILYNLRRDGTGFEEMYAYLASLEYGDYNLSSNVVCDTNIKTLDGTEKTICVYADKTLPTNTSITVDISDGTTTLSAQALNTPIGLNTLSAAAALELTFNLATTDTTATPELKGYGVFIK